MATNQYPTYGMDTGMGMNRSSGGGVSNALRQGAQAQRVQGPSYARPQNTQYGQGMTQQPAQDNQARLMAQRAAQEANMAASGAQQYSSVSQAQLQPGGWSSNRFGGGQMGPGSQPSLYGHGGGQAPYTPSQYQPQQGMVQQPYQQPQQYQPTAYNGGMTTGQDMARSSGARGGGAPIDRPYTPEAQPGQVIVRDANGAPIAVPQPQQPAVGTQAPSNQFNWFPGMDPTSLQNNDERDAAMQAVQASLPIWQAQQNANQWGSEFNESQRRDDRDFGWQSQLDQFGMSLALQQQGMSEWQANEAASQWAASYNRDVSNDQWNQGFANRQLGLQEYSTTEGLNQSAQRMNNDFALGNRNADIQAQANQIDQMYKTGQLDLGARNAALAELTQSQNYGLQSRQLGTQEQELARRFGLDTQTQADLNVYRQQQMAQEAALAREQLAAQQQMAIMQTYGRNQRPNARWARNF